MTKQSKCPHSVIRSGPAGPFFHGVAERTEDMNDAAHGHLRWRETCELCGASREVLYNNGHFENSLWHKETP